MSQSNKTTHYVLTKFRTDDALRNTHIYLDESNAREEYRKWKDGGERDAFLQKITTEITIEYLTR